MLLKMENIEKCSRVIMFISNFTVVTKKLHSLTCICKFKIYGMTAKCSIVVVDVVDLFLVENREIATKNHVQEDNSLPIS